ncbi:MAG TPA: HEAT repeat domain-containing protein [Pyrinomonadaceae bacterium]|nr:HEAT repeat domain-containing protein [Pyrinomonadaceae bacterium]
MSKALKFEQAKRVSVACVLAVLAIVAATGATMARRQVASAAGAPAPTAKSVAAEAPAEVRALVARLRAESPVERAQAACALGRMEARAASAIPVLVELLNDGAPVAQTCGNEHPFEDEAWQPDYESVRETTVGEAATHALMAVGRDALEPLTETLTNRNATWRARKNAAWALSHTGDRRAMQRMLVALRDPAWQVRVQAAYALFQRGSDDRETVEALAVAATQDEVWQVRHQAAFALGHKGSSEADVPSRLVRVMLTDKDARVRREAAGGLWHMAGAREFPSLLEALKDKDARVRETAAETLGNRAGNDEVPLLIAALKDTDARIREGARRALKIVKQRSEGRVTNLRPLPPGIPE